MTVGRGSTMHEAGEHDKYTCVESPPADYYTDSVVTPPARTHLFNLSNFYFSAIIMNGRKSASHLSDSSFDFFSVSFWERDYGILARSCLYDHVPLTRRDPPSCLDDCTTLHLASQRILIYIGDDTPTIR